jgi:hypothetical protein
LFDHPGTQIGIDQTTFGSVHGFTKRSNRNLFFAGEACEPRTFKDVHSRLPDFYKVSHNVLQKIKRAQNPNKPTPL